jgi:hypothetical protein
MNKLYKDFGYYLDTDNKVYAINKVYIFMNNEVKVVANYFLDNFNKYEFTFDGEVKKKNKIDLNEKCNFVVKSQIQDSWDNVIRQDLYINGDINGYEFIGLHLNDCTKKNDRLDLVYKINGVECKHCVGWNNKLSIEIKIKMTELHKQLAIFRIDNKDYQDNIKRLERTYKEYKKALETEENYLPFEYEKMRLASGTTEEENKLMIHNNLKDRFKSIK